MGMMSKSTAAYIAGFVDGEGTITITPGISKVNGARYYRTYIGIANTNKEIIYWFRDSFGGSVRISDKQPNKWKPIYKWHLGNKEQIEKFLRAIKPYLRLKKRNAEIIIEFYRLFGEDKHVVERRSDGTIKSRHVKPVVQQKRDALHKEMSKLNHRGVFAR